MAADQANSLPQADLRRWPVPAATLNRLPRDVAVEFEAAFYDESPDFLYLGLVHPELMKESAKDALRALERQLGKRILLARLTEKDWQRLLDLYDEPVARPSEKNWPDNWQSGQMVDEVLLKMLPADFCRDRHVVPVSFAEPNTLWLGTDRPLPDVAALAELIGRRNRLTVRLAALDSGEFNRVLELVRAAAPLAAEAPTEAPAEPAAETEELTAAEVAPEVTGVESDLVIPKITGRIVSSDVEKSGLSGLMQKAGLAFNQRPAEGDTKPTQAEPNNEKADAPAENAQSLEGQLAVPPAVPLEPELAPAPPKMPHPSGPAEAEASGTGQNSKPEQESKSELKPAPAPSRPVVPKVTAQGVVKDNTAADTSSDGGAFGRPVTDIRQLENIVRQGSVIRIVGALISLAADRRASDIHIEPYGDELVVRYRVDGQLGEVIKLPMELHPPVVSRIKIMAKLKLDEARVPQDGRFDVKAAEKAIDIRVSTLPTVHGEKVVLRLLDKSSGLITLENLGLTGDGFNRLIKAIQKSYGVVLSTGPTGSGKTTTLYAILQRVATTNVNVVTLEDPVEYEIRGINQSQIKPKIGFTFADGLRSILRQDPNVIMVGEVRDGETASMVTHAALTGHLVLSTLHTNDAAGALPRLTNMGIEPFLITSAMNAIVGQRLVRRLEDETKERVELPPSVRKEIDVELENIRRVNPKEAERIPERFEFFKPHPTDGNPTGYKGRVGLYEVMLMDSAVEELAVRHAPADELRQAAVSAGMITMRQDGILKVLAGQTSIDEVWHETSNR